MLEGGQVVFRQTKMLLPTYDVFDEARYFRPAEREDLLHPARRAASRSPSARTPGTTSSSGSSRLYQRDPVEELVAAGARDADQHQRLALSHGQARAAPRDVYRAVARRYEIPVVYVNQVGGNDQLVFDGSSFAMDADGRSHRRRRAPSTKTW